MTNINSWKKASSCVLGQKYTKRKLPSSCSAIQFPGEVHFWTMYNNFNTTSCIYIWILRSTTKTRPRHVLSSVLKISTCTLWLTPWQTNIALFEADYVLSSLRRNVIIHPLMKGTGIVLPFSFEYELMNWYILLWFRFH